MTRYPSNIYDGFCTGSRYYVYIEDDCSEHDFSRLCDAKKFALDHSRFPSECSVFERLPWTSRKLFTYLGRSVVGYYDGVSFVHLGYDCSYSVCNLDNCEICNE